MRILGTRQVVQIHYLASLAGSDKPVNGFALSRYVQMTRIAIGVFRNGGSGTIRLKDGWP
jgi:hypothetical protein